MPGLGSGQVCLHRRDKQKRGRWHRKIQTVKATFKYNLVWGAWVAQLVKHLVMSQFGSGHDLTVRGFKPCVRLCADSSEPAAASDPVSPSLSTPLLLAICLALSKINKHLKKLINKYNLVLDETIYLK